MDLEWQPDILIPERTITMITSPSQIVINGLNSCSGTMRRYPLLYVCSNFSRVLPGLHRSVSGFSVRRGFTSDQISTIISECDATYLFIEHDPSLYEEDTRLIPVVTNKIKTFAREHGTVIIYSDQIDRFMRHIMRASHRVYLYAEWADLIRRRIRQQQLHGRNRSPREHQARLGIFDRPACEKNGNSEDIVV